jgi:hypothetical protein
MALSAFIDRAQQPDEAELRETLGAQWAQWQSIRQYVADAPAGSTEEWKFYGRSSGWTLLLKRKKRTILYLFPGLNRLTVLFVFGEAAVTAAARSDLPEPVKAAIRDAKPYMEGRSFQVDVASVDDVEMVKYLITIKTTA